MMRFLVLLIIAGLMVSGCSSVDVYTFKKERVDQDIKGNEGYVEGEKPAGEEKPRNPKRTLFGVDIEMAGSDDDYDEEEVKTERSDLPSEDKITDTDKAGAKASQPGSVETKKYRSHEEDQWIK